MLTALIFSFGIKKIPHLVSFLPNETLTFYRPWLNLKGDKVLGWGLRPSTKKARTYAKQHNLPFVALEDGFLRSIGLGVNGYPPMSIVVDSLGIYYDTSTPSELEQLVLAQPDEAPPEAQQALDLILKVRLSKYNHAVDFSGSFTKPAVLVVDQTFGDMAVKYGQADESHFHSMLQAAIAENPHAIIVVKTHPDVLSGKKKGYLTLQEDLPENVQILTEDVNPLSLIAVVEKVYCVTSQMGFEALLAKKKVITFGVPWFAGWGITEDRHPQAQALAQSERRKVRSVLQLFYAAYFQYSRYINPNTGQTGTIFDVIDYLTKMKSLNNRLRGNLYCVGMSLWKRAVIRPFFHLPSCKLHFVSKVTKLNHKKWKKSDRLLLWGVGKETVLEYANRNGISVLRIEDGFIRSVGLGSNLVAPLSLVCDDLGIYFNAQKPSRLEQILQTQVFSEADLQQASELQKELIVQHINKYNVGEHKFSLPQTSKTKILVVGQVEDDASIRTGSPKIFTNLGLLQAVRKANPQAYIVYKPHPDVISGNRVGEIPLEQAVKFADQFADNENVLDCIQAVDELHTMTSLAGFEALLRGKKVYCYGLPFYAGWGLTIDKLPITRRTRKLTLLELIAGSLVYYPQYINPYTGEMTNALSAIYLLKQQRENLEHSGIHRNWFSKQWGKLRHLLITLKNEFILKNEI
ncbi:beta-3-deoxy-D-manno-oct-2-ulosonic acid transferase [Rodentibacter genomosp. 1]|uniref:Beta-3-deoxy-D-manno-oct-2-ulosonic acid transferase n=1 Tax=Rodentibacter genomosp. 1 TaxID=1908264 RepID=A0A1V3J9Y1_9PAST|nr:capsular polysaccharide biosynthesis protein [Rodentibacter genomosp. 1]OOF52086.1 beta-3-deoxy-D-manno-oct-2-ulosonic acid transferase [Rodentibacter genomosp. 1]